MKSPCVAACKNNGGICSGCHRTMDEIVNWRHLSDEDRDQVMDQLAGEESTHNCPSCGNESHCDISAGKETCWCFGLETRDLPKPSPDQKCLCRRCLEKTDIA